MMIGQHPCLAGAYVNRPKQWPNAGKQDASSPETSQFVL